MILTLFPFILWKGVLLELDGDDSVLQGPLFSIIEFVTLSVRISEIGSDLLYFLMNIETTSWSNQIVDVNLLHGAEQWDFWTLFLP